MSRLFLLSVTLLGCSLTPALANATLVCGGFAGLENSDRVTYSMDQTDRTGTLAGIGKDRRMKCAMRGSLHLQCNEMDSEDPKFFANPGYTLVLSLDPSSSTWTKGELFLSTYEASDKLASGKCAQSP